jgi:pimeloyl-ACP methyl ester carboxylesterase
MDVLAYGAGFPSAKLILPRRPSPDQLRGLSVPTSVLVAEQSRTHDAHRVAENARRLVSDVVTVVVPDATHHTMPLQDLSAWWPVYIASQAAEIGPKARRSPRALPILFMA